MYFELWHQLLLMLYILDSSNVIILVCFVQYCSILILRMSQCLFHTSTGFVVEYFAGCSICNISRFFFQVCWGHFDTRRLPAS